MDGNNAIADDDNNNDRNDAATVAERQKQFARIIFDRIQADNSLKDDDSFEDIMSVNPKDLHVVIQILLEARAIPLREELADWMYL